MLGLAPFSVDDPFPRLEISVGMRVQSLGLDHRLPSELLFLSAAVRHSLAIAQVLSRLKH